MIDRKQLTMFAFVASSLLLSNDEALCASQNSLLVLDPWGHSVEFGSAKASSCDSVDVSSVVSIEGVEPCVTQSISHVVGALCISFEWFCSTQSRSTWLAAFFEKNKNVSDAIFDQDTVTLLGEKDDVSWRIQMFADSLDDQKIQFLFSALRAATRSEPNESFESLEMRSFHSERASQKLVPNHRPRRRFKKFSQDVHTSN